MWELRYYTSKGTLAYEVVDRYNNPGLAYGMKKKKGLEPQYYPRNLRVIKV